MSPDHPLTVLVVEDNPVNVKVAALHLTQMGHEMIAASDGAEALKLLSRERFDAVLLDICMPGVSGLDVCRRLRASEGPDCPRIVAYTAHAVPEMLDEMHETGFDEILIKPITEEGLLRALRLT